MLHGEPPADVVEYKVDAPRKRSGVEVVALEAGRDQVVISLASRPGDALSVSPDVFQLVDPAGDHGVLGHFRAARSPVDPIWDWPGTISFYAGEPGVVAGV